MHHDIKNLIVPALAAVEKHLMTEEGKVVKEYNGYASSLGASIRMSGLLPALTFYTNVKDSVDHSAKPPKPQRHRLLTAIADVLDLPLPADDDPQGRVLLKTVVAAAYPNANTEDANVQLSTRGETKELVLWEQKITKASVALKLAMRSFPHTNDDNR